MKVRNRPLHHHSETLVSTNFAKYRPQRVKVSYRQVTVPKMTENDGMGGFLDESAYLPCTDCLITYMSSSLEFPDGTIADANAGMWLHHAVFVNQGRADTVCPVGSYGQRFYATGNERTPIDISVGRLVFTNLAYLTDAEFHLVRIRRATISPSTTRWQSRLS